MLGTTQPRGKETSFLARVLLTFIAPAALVLLGPRAPVLGVPLDVAARNGVSIFAIDLRPVFWAFGLVELFALVVPSVAPNRHDAPDVRARLDRAAGALAVAVATWQAYSLTSSLVESADWASAPFNVSLATASLVGGVCLQFVVARWISRQGLMNGLVAMFGADAVVSAYYATSRFWDSRPSMQTCLKTVAAVAVLLAAAGFVLHEAGCTPTHRSERSNLKAKLGRDHASPPWCVPIPAGSLQPYVLAASVLMLPALLTGFGLPLKKIERFLTDDRAFEPIFAVTVCALTWLLSRLLHRPTELAGVAARFDQPHPSALLADDLRIARRRALPASLLFMLVLVLAGPTSRIGAVGLVTLVAIVIDLRHALRLARSREDYVAVWDDRRAAALPALRAVLADGGIATQTLGASFSQLWQCFAPYAPAQLLVLRSDAAQAGELLSRRSKTEASGPPKGSGPLAYDARRFGVFGLLFVFACQHPRLARSEATNQSRSQRGIAAPSSRNLSPPATSLQNPEVATTRSSVFREKFSSTPMMFARAMTGTFFCGNGTRCSAGSEVCVSQALEGSSHCEQIRAWSQNERTPEPRNGTPRMGGLAACGDSSNCPAPSLCCLHEVGNAEIQAVVCHASLNECRDHVELCNPQAVDVCRTPGTHCSRELGQCVATP